MEYHGSGVISGTPIACQESPDCSSVCRIKGLKHSASYACGVYKSSYLHKPAIYLNIFAFISFAEKLCHRTSVINPQKCILILSIPQKIGISAYGSSDVYSIKAQIINVPISPFSDSKLIYRNGKGICHVKIIVCSTRKGDFYFIVSSVLIADGSD